MLLGCFLASYSAFPIVCMWRFPKSLSRISAFRKGKGVSGLRKKEKKKISCK